MLLSFDARVKANDVLKNVKVEAKKAGKKFIIKREPVGPSAAYVVDYSAKVGFEYMNPLKFRELY